MTKTHAYDIAHDKEHNEVINHSKYMMQVQVQSRQRCSTTKSVLKNVPIFTGKCLCLNLFLTPTQVLFSCEYCRRVKNTCFEEHL